MMEVRLQYLLKVQQSRNLVYPQEMISMERVQNKVQGMISGPWNIQNYLKYERRSATICDSTVLQSAKIPSCTESHGSTTRGHR